MSGYFFMLYEPLASIFAAEVMRVNMGSQFCQQDLLGGTREFWITLPEIV